MSDKSGISDEVEKLVGELSEFSDKEIVTIMKDLFGKDVFSQEMLSEIRDAVVEQKKYRNDLEDIPFYDNGDAFPGEWHKDPDEQISMAISKDKKVMIWRIDESPVQEVHQLEIGRDYKINETSRGCETYSIQFIGPDGSLGDELRVYHKNGEIMDVNNGAGWEDTPTKKKQIRMS